MTDRDGLYGAARFADACQQVSGRVAPVRPIHGATLTVRTRTQDTPVVVLAKDARGYANLCTLITTAHMTGERGDPALTTSQVCERADGLIALIGPETEPGELAAARFAERPDLCDASLDIAEACRFDLGIGKVHFPEFPTPRGRSASSVLAERCWRGIGERGMRVTTEVRDRLDFELGQIHFMGYAA